MKIVNVQTESKTVSTSPEEIPRKNLYSLQELEKLMNCHEFQQSAPKLLSITNASKKSSPGLLPVIQNSKSVGDFSFCGISCQIDMENEPVSVLKMTASVLFISNLV